MMSISTFHFNIRSLSANHDSMAMLILELQHVFDVTSHAETKVKDSCDSSNNIAINGYDLGSKPTFSNAGGTNYGKFNIQYNGPILWNETDKKFRILTPYSLKRELSLHFTDFY